MEDWNNYIKKYRIFLQLEKGLQGNSILAYESDILKFTQFLEINGIKLSPLNVKIEHLRNFIEWINEFGISSGTQARIISGLKSFFKYLLIDELIETNPASLLEAPKLSRKLPEILSVDEIDMIIAAIDLSKDEGHRNKAIIETLYSCGLRVSELTDLKMSDLYFNDSFIKILGKGNKQRLVPISQRAINYINTYISTYRNRLDIKDGHQDNLFLNRRGRKLTRVMIFTIVKNLSQEAGLKKNVSPHTFRHSFATHLVEGGADLRAVQEMLGHESILTTEIYTHLDDSYLRDTILTYHPRS